MPVANTIAYLASSSVTKEKKFYNIGTRWFTIVHFLPVPSNVAGKITLKFKTMGISQPGHVISNGREPRGYLGQIFNFKFKQFCLMTAKSIT